MKILRIIARLNVGGPARHVIWLTKDLQDGEFESTLIAGKVPMGEEDMSYLACESGVSPHYIEEMSRELSLKDAISLLKIYREIKRAKPDIIHTHTAKAGTVGRSAAFFYRWLTWSTLIGKPRRVRIVHTFHGHVFHNYYGNLTTKLFVAIEKMFAWLATDKIIVISPQQLREINGDFGVGRKIQFETIPLGIDLRPFADNYKKRKAFRDELRADESEVLVGFVGRLTEIKNISMFLKVAGLVRKCEHKMPKIRFVIVGDGHLREPLEDEAQAISLGESALFLGNRIDTDAVYAGVDIVALTSLNEGTPLSLIEAMACGRPVISTEVGAVVDLLGEIEQEHDEFTVRERGIGVQTNSPEKFLKGLIYLAKSEKLRDRLAARGLAFVQKNYSKDRLVNDMKKLYRGLMELK